MTPRLALDIPQPCSANWDAMTPTAHGRHCAVCQKTVVDFTQKTDAEILALLARSSGALCGRVAAAQLGRPLQPLELAPPAQWRTWLAAAVALWGLREAGGTTTQAQTPTEQHSRRMPVGLPDHLKAIRKPEYEGPARVVRGVVLDSITGEGLPSVSISLPHTPLATTTQADGRFELVVPFEQVATEHVQLKVSYIGYQTQQVIASVSTEAKPVRIQLVYDNQELIGEIVIGTMTATPPAFPHRLYNWLTRPFRRD